ncbi:MAG: hypothetical protein QY332_01935 [Anaerolineales bacterium]|nr:MAG: hypothetical protein QY332_01935 [Anaerolineales bacterium]
MISSFVSYQPQIQLNIAPIRTPDGLSRIFAAAVVNRQFCQMLLQDPHNALQKGYLGETFPLSKQERDVIVSIRAETLADFARQLNSALRNH